MAKMKWKGVLLEDLHSPGGSLYKGEKVIVWKKRTIPKEGKQWNGKYEYHYTRQSDGKGFIRTDKFIIDEFVVVSAKEVQAQIYDALRLNKRNWTIENLVNLTGFTRRRIKYNLKLMRKNGLPVDEAFKCNKGYCYSLGWYFLDSTL